QLGVLFRAQGADYPAYQRRPGLAWRSCIWADRRTRGSSHSARILDLAARCPGPGIAYRCNLRLAGLRRRDLWLWSGSTHPCRFSLVAGAGIAGYLRHRCAPAQPAAYWNRAGNHLIDGGRTLDGFWLAAWAALMASAGHLCTRYGPHR